MRGGTKVWDDLLIQIIVQFQDALSSKIYIDKMGLISYTNGVIDMTE